MKLADIKIGTKLMAGFGIVLALVTLQSLYSIVQTARINDQSTVMATHWMPAACRPGRPKEFPACARPSSNTC